MAWYLPDHLGTIRDITNSTGAVVDHLDYDGFGKTSTTPTGGDRYLFTSREYDSETGLYYSRNRYYNPSLGRWLSQDPLGLGVDSNPYRYVGNSPTNYTDPSGLKAQPAANGLDAPLEGTGTFGPGGVWIPPMIIPPPGNVSGTLHPPAMPIDNVPAPPPDDPKPKPRPQGNFGSQPRPDPVPWPSTVPIGQMSSSDDYDPFGGFNVEGTFPFGFSVVFPPYANIETTFSSWGSASMSSDGSPSSDHKPHHDHHGNFHGGNGSGAMQSGGQGSGSMQSGGGQGSGNMQSGGQGFATMQGGGQGFSTMQGGGQGFANFQSGGFGYGTIHNNPHPGHHGGFQSNQQSQGIDYFPLYMAFAIGQTGTGGGPKGSMEAQQKAKGKLDNKEECHCTCDDGGAGQGAMAAGQSSQMGSVDLEQYFWVSNDLYAAEGYAELRSRQELQSAFGAPERNWNDQSPIDGGEWWARLQAQEARNASMFPDLRSDTNTLHTSHDWDKVLPNLIRGVARKHISSVKASLWGMPQFHEAIDWADTYIPEFPKDKDPWGFSQHSGPAKLGEKLAKISMKKIGGQFQQTTTLVDPTPNTVVRNLEVCGDLEMAELMAQVANGMAFDPIGAYTSYQKGKDTGDWTDFQEWLGGAGYEASQCVAAPMLLEAKGVGGLTSVPQRGGISLRVIEQPLVGRYRIPLRVVDQPSVGRHAPLEINVTDRLWQQTWREAQGMKLNPRRVVEGAIDLETGASAVRASGMPPASSLALPRQQLESFPQGVCGMPRAVQAVIDQTGAADTLILATQGGFRFRNGGWYYVSPCRNCEGVFELNPNLQRSPLPPGVSPGLPPNTQVPFTPPPEWEW